MSQIARDKAKSLVDKMVEEDGLDVPAMLQRKIEDRIYHALKEQDRDTRHACSDAVLENKNNPSGACINARAI
jgi:hypothetical protein